MECLSLLRKEVKSKVHWIPCGKCVNCMINRQNNWVFRMEQEIKVSKSAIFTTLTYNPENIPLLVNEDTGEIQQSLRYSDIQKFMKRLRKNHKGIKVKHYTVGEYGDNTQRPHYHQILFNVKREQVAKLWNHGYTKIGEINPARIRYVTKYMGKRIANTPEGSEIPKNVMSQGLGLSYALDEENRRHHKDHLIDSVITTGGVRVPLPRYIKDKIFTEDELHKMKIINACRRDADLQYLWDRCQTPEKLHFELLSQAHEKLAQAKHNERMQQKKSKCKDL